ncbi:MAG: hypothetical protein K0R18_337 [Bacillales bacterium]|nr:hypothetical protein [Bacillales bacterium]
MEEKIKKTHELFKNVEQEPSEENCIAFVQSTFDLEVEESIATMAVAMRSKPGDGNQTLKSILLTLPIWVTWARKYREYVDTPIMDDNKLRRNEIIAELGLNIEPFKIR